MSTVKLIRLGSIINKHSAAVNTTKANIIIRGFTSAMSLSINPEVNFCSMPKRFRRYDVCGPLNLTTLKNESFGESV